jgi:hypothetical protein
VPVRTYYGRLKRRFTAEDVQANVQRRMYRLFAGDPPSVFRSAPTIGTPARTVWNTSTTPKSTSVGGTGSGSLTWAPGDMVVVLALTADQATTLNAPTGPATLGVFASCAGPVTTASSCWARAWVSIALESGSGVITATVAAGSANWGMAAWSVVAPTSEGIGNVSAPAASTASPQVASLIRARNDSGVLAIVGDWGAGVGGVGTVPSPRNWTPAGFAEWEAFGVSGIYNGYVASWGGQGVAATVNYGISVTGSGSNYTRMAVEILGAPVTDALPFLFMAPLGSA